MIAVYAEVTAAQQAQLAASGIPLVALDPTGEPLHSTPSVGAANWSGGVAATRHLLDLGHRRIAVIGGPAEFLCARARLDGFRAAMDAAGVPVDPRLVRDRPVLLRGRPRATGRDLLAPARAADRGVLRQRPAGARRLRGGPAGRACAIPDDLSVVGFDDLEFARWCGPPLTTVRQPLAEMGAAAAEPGARPWPPASTPAQHPRRAGHHARRAARAPPPPRYPLDRRRHARRARCPRIRIDHASNRRLWFDRSVR